MSTNRTCLELLQEELLRIIVHYLTEEDIAHISQTCCWLDATMPKFHIFCQHKCFLTDTVRDVDCCLWYEKDEMKKCNLCEKCMLLKWQLDKSCKRHNATSPATKRKRQEASSKYLFVYLSPASQKMKTKNLQKAVASTQRAVTDVIERMPINDIQNDEIADLVHSINNSKEGQNELEKIFAEADKSGEGCGELTKQIWEADVDDVQKFLLDQRKNDMSVNSSSCHLRIQFFAFNRYWPKVK